MSSEVEDQYEMKLDAPPYNEELADRRRKLVVTKKHSIGEKMLLYNSSTKGDLVEIQSVCTKQFSLLEEVSKAGYYWTVFHYASHYGHVELLEWLLEQFDNHANKYEIYNLQTAEGKTPVFCAILSGDIDIEKKKVIIKMWFDTWQVDTDIRKKSGEDLLELARKNNLYDFIVEHCLRED